MGTVCVCVCVYACVSPLEKVPNGIIITFSIAYYVPVWSIWCENWNSYFVKVYPAR